MVYWNDFISYEALINAGEQPITHGVLKYKSSLVIFATVKEQPITHGVLKSKRWWF